MRTAYMIFYCAVRFSLSNKGGFLISYNSTRSLASSFDTTWTLEQVEQRNRSICSYRKREHPFQCKVNPITTTEQKLWTIFFLLDFRCCYATIAFAKGSNPEIFSPVLSFIYEHFHSALWLYVFFFCIFSKYLNSTFSKMSNTMEDRWRTFRRRVCFIFWIFSKKKLKKRKQKYLLKILIKPNVWKNV